MNSGNAPIQFVRKEYGFNADRASVLRDGSDNTVWLLEERGGKKFVARVGKRRVRDDIAFEAGWLRFLTSKNVPVPKIIESKAGNVYTTLPDGSAVTIFEFMHGKHLAFDTYTPPPLEAVVSAAQTLALLHDISRGNDLALPRHRTIYTELERALAHERKITETVPGGIDLLRAVKKFVALKSGDKPVLVHNDYRISNVMFDKHCNVAAVVDFDWSCMGPAIKDVSHVLAEWSFPDGAKTHWQKIFRSFLDNYNKVAEEKIEVNGWLYEWIAFSCLSDTCTYIVDSLEREDAKPISGSYMYRKFLYFQTQPS